MQEIDSFVCYHKLKGILPSVPDQEFELWLSSAIKNNTSYISKVCGWVFYLKVILVAFINEQAYLSPVGTIHLSRDEFLLDELHIFVLPVYFNVLLKVLWPSEWVILIS